MPRPYGLLALCVSWILPLAAQDGRALYQKHCASCHDGAAARAPQLAALKQMSPENVAFALKSGTMQVQGASLTQAEIRTVSEFVTGKATAKQAFEKQAYCPDAGPPIEQAVTQPQWNGWGADLSNHRFQPSAMAQISAAEVPRLKLKWAFAFPGDARAYAQPAVIGSRIYVGSLGRRVYSLNASSGCTYWVIEADFPVRSAIAPNPRGRISISARRRFWLTSRTAAAH